MTCRVCANEVNVKDTPYNAKGNGIGNDTVAINKAIKAIKDSGGVLIFPGGNYVVDNLDFPRNATVKFNDGAILKIAAGATVNFNGRIDAGTHRIFDGAGSVKFKIRSERAVYPQWWGAVADYFKEDGLVNPNASDSWSSFQKALDSLPNTSRNGAEEGGVVRIPSGAYKIGSSLCVRANNVTIKGDGYSSYLRFTGDGGSGIYFEHGTKSGECRYFQIVSDLTMMSSTVDKILDISGASYSLFENLNFQTRKDKSACIYGQGDNGSCPYYNLIRNITLGGNWKKTDTTGIRFCHGNFSEDGSGGANGNFIDGIHRAYSLTRMVDLQAGNGNSFSNINAESIVDAYFDLGNRPPSITGKLSGATAGTGTDKSAEWRPNQILNGAIEITGGKGAGQVRWVTGNNTNTFNIENPWKVIPDSTSAYTWIKSNTSDIMISDIRGEGHAGCAFVKHRNGTHNVRCNNICVGSIGMYWVQGKHYDTQSRYWGVNLVPVAFEMKTVPDGFGSYTLKPLGSAHVPMYAWIEGMSISCSGYKGGSISGKLYVGSSEVTAARCVIDKDRGTNYNAMFYAASTDSKWVRPGNSVRVNLEADQNWRQADIHVTVWVRKAG